MDQEFLERYARHLPLKSIGKSGQLKLKGRNVLIAGMGGLGTVSSELLASIGIGFLRIVDYDIVELSNLPRQKLYTDQDIGKAKVEVAEIQLKNRNRDIKIDSQATRIDALSAPTLLDDIDLVIDALDKFSSRKALFRVARKLDIPYIFCGSVAESANIMSFTYKEEEPCLECVIGNVGDDPEQSCEVLGVNPTILSIAASIQVSEAIKILLGEDPSLSGKMMYISLEDLDFDKITFTKNPDCRICGTSSDYDDDVDELDKGEDGEITKGIREIGTHGRALVTSLCGRDTKIIDPEWEISWEFENIRALISKNYHIAVEGTKYITFNVEGVGVSLLNSGVATIRGSKTTKRAISTFDKVLSLISNN